MDQMVLKVQEWLEDTYRGKYGYIPVEPNGRTGWDTMYSLISALQIEEGIPEPNGYFGPETTRRCPTLSINSNSSSTTVQNQIYILQGALFCKGYNPTGFTGYFGNGTKAAIEKFQTDAGLSNADGIATPMIIKALLNMDAFVNVGDPKIRIIQQNLNRDYHKIIGLMPCDGRYSRSTNTALIYALQIEEGITEPNGVFGPQTKARCPVLSVGSENKFVSLLQYALYCNHYDPTGFTGYFGNGTKSAVKNFQEFSCLPADGVANMQTWASLLISTGDNTRKGTACDCATTITPEKAATLKNNGYKSIGRYLTGRYRMTYSELATIFAFGLNVFPIFETGGYELSYFTAEQGTFDANSAKRSAGNLGFGADSTVYFAVDFDALDGDVTDAVLPYFKAIRDEVDRLGNPYKIGIYGPRNVCSRVADAGYSINSFVCDMSTGFSGNLGYSLPKDWSFDQIATITIGTGAGQIEIDNNIASGRDIGVCEDTKKVIKILKRLDSAANTYISQDGLDSNTLVLNFLRRFVYTGYQWLLTIGVEDKRFYEYLCLGYPDIVADLMPYIQAENTRIAYINNNPIDLPHLAATTLGHNSFLVPHFWTGWGGDLATTMSDITKEDRENKNGRTIQKIAEDVMGSDLFTFPREDVIADIDAIYIEANKGHKDLASLLEKYYSSVDGDVRRSILFKSLEFKNNPSINELSEKIYDLMTGSKGFKYVVGLGQLTLLKKATYTTPDTHEKIEPTEEIQKAAALAFSKYIINKL
ncbi:putative peptidoglycan binding domain protein [Clostridium argentinense CDC 2741]|uniref:Uncharacterized protein n=2 Tax=Clostridium argentinense TaxID=29341 RepID=A0A7I6N2T9_9CLOT|nr:glycoside hydrolase domain-containing protein [Clostridium argentinense]ARC83147.1 hypothetical protein RSJ17_00410 [Clostridium argentinense]KIE44398.1 putative peptidoglycan binding domain protein [Clostridium argentinense CDC 2741]NFF41612.1 DUF1906 domain-containing protein [Clostridium argentinense]NFP52312.1 DUF1906 domain-containing protein [Clostridium argentinense]NFP74675.1 DUF1906 domain-containing protein [Clostridium argentinense]